MSKRIFVVGGSFLFLVLGGACQVHNTEASSPVGLSEQWKPLYQMCMKRSVHQSPALAVHLDMGRLSDRCRTLALEAIRRFQ
jgi:hypothetical protein